MPIYEFQCQACGTEIEILQKINDPHPTNCEACGKAEMKKKVTAAAFRLSGAGWYETDFKESDKKKNLTETSSDKKESTKETSSKDSTNKESSSKDSTASSDKESGTSSNKSEPSASESSTKESHKAKKTETPKTD